MLCAGKKQYGAEYVQQTKRFFDEEDVPMGMPVPRQALTALKPYVPGKPIEEVQRELGLQDVIKLASNENPLGASLKVQQTIARVAGEIHLYPDGNCYQLKQEVAKFLTVAPDNLIIGNGSDEVLKMLAECYLNEQDEVVMAWPTFSEYEFVTRLMGALCNTVSLKDHRHCLPAMAAAITPQTKIVFICNPNNPTGTIVTRQELDEFLTKVPANVLVVLDEAYHEYTTDPDYPAGLDLIKQGIENVVVLRTFSKIYGLAGLRVGYGVAAAPVIAMLSKTREPFNVNRVGQAAAITALADQDHVLNSAVLNRDGLIYLATQFEAMGLSYIPSQANFVMVDIRKDCRQVFASLLRLGVIVRTGDIFGMDTYIRVTVGTAEENQRFIEALSQVLK